MVVGEGGEIEFVDEANTFTECTVPLRPELAGQQQKFPPKPGFELTSLRQLHQFAGTKIERLPGCVLCDTMLDESSALFKSARYEPTAASPFSSHLPTLSWYAGGVQEAHRARRRDVRQVVPPLSGRGGAPRAGLGQGQIPPHSR